VRKAGGGGDTGGGRGVGGAGGLVEEGGGGLDVALLVEVEARQEVTARELGDSLLLGWKAGGVREDE
jgi:hypothetical protein